jgi:hypothetical protein
VIAFLKTQASCRSISLDQPEDENVTEDKMDGTFDIFKKTPDKGTVWVEAVVGIVEAKKALLRYQRLHTTDEYLVFDASEGHFIDILGNVQSA